MDPNTTVQVKFDLQPTTVEQQSINEQYGIFQKYTYLDCGVPLCVVFLPHNDTTHRFREQDLKIISLEEYTRGRKPDSEPKEPS